MKYYVPVGRGGAFFSVGMVVSGMMGSVVYWCASFRRGAARPMKLASPIGQSGRVIGRSGTSSVIATGSSPARPIRGAAMMDIER
jgi:hypothetical protein